MINQRAGGKEDIILEGVKCYYEWNLLFLDEFNILVSHSCAVSYCVLLYFISAEEKIGNRTPEHLLTSPGAATKICRIVGLLPDHVVQRRVSQVCAKHLQQEQVLQLLPTEGGPLGVGHPAQQGQQEDLQVRLPLCGPGLGLFQSDQQVRVWLLDWRNGRKQGQ